MGPEHLFSQPNAFFESWSWAFLLVSVLGAWLTWNAYRPVRWPAVLGFVSFFAGWLTCELALYHLCWQIIVAVVFVVMGGLHQWPGWLALGIFGVSWTGLFYLHRRGHLAHGVINNVFKEVFKETTKTNIEMNPNLVSFRTLMFPFLVHHRQVSRSRGHVFSEINGKKLRADIYCPRKKPSDGQQSPVLIFVHGGAWVSGFKKYQALPMLNRLAADGWVCMSIDYRLSPRATFPDHITDVKRSIVWAKENIHQFGGDPNFIAISGNSAGGHLASLAALTWDDPLYQPGFETADTRVQACVSFYGVYDFLNRFGHWPHLGLKRLLERLVFKASIKNNPHLFDQASPMSRVREDAPPFFAIHGDKDTMVPVEEARSFIKSLRAVSTNPVCYAEIPDAQHAFDMFRSPRSHYTLRAVHHFLNTVAK